MAWSDSLCWSSGNRYFLKLSTISTLVFILDQWTKKLVITYLGVPGKRAVIGEFLQLTLVFNEGGAFSTRFGPTMFYAAASVLVMVFVIGFLYREAGKSRLLDLALALVIGGALGNLLDRVRFGSVIDWVDVDFFDIHLAPGKLLFFDFPGYDLTRWPVFNVADSAVSVGMVLLISSLIISSRERKNASSPTDC
jgi:signal peptidase II